MGINYYKCEQHKNYFASIFKYLTSSNSNPWSASLAERSRSFYAKRGEGQINAVRSRHEHLARVRDSPLRSHRGLVTYLSYTNCGRAFARKAGTSVDGYCEWCRYSPRVHSAISYISRALSRTALNTPDSGSFELLTEALILSNS